MNTIDLSSVRNEIIGIDAEVTLLDGTTRRYINFDNASTTPCLRPVLDRVSHFLRWYGSVGRGAGFKSEVSTQAIEEARRIVASFVGADLEAHTVLFTKNTTEAINKLAHRFPFTPNNVVLCSMMEHHSNDLPWRAAAQVERAAIDREGRIDLDHLKQQLQSLQGQVRLVVVTGGSNVTGHINPIHDIAALAHAAGAQILVDAAQLAAHRPIAMGPPGGARSIDYLAFCAHKMYAPFGVGVLVGLKEAFLQDNLDCVGGGTVDLVTAEDVQWSGLPNKEEAGTPNAVGIVALAEAIRCLQQIDLERVAKHEARLTAHLLQGLRNIEGIRIYGDDDPNLAAGRLGVVSIAVEGVPHQLVAAILAAEGGIGVRTGLFCAHPYVLELLDCGEDELARLRQDLVSGIRERFPGLTRVSLGLYNSEWEIDVLLKLLGKITSRSYAGQYEQDSRSGTFYVAGCTMQAEDVFTIGG